MNEADLVPNEFEAMISSIYRMMVKFMETGDDKLVATAAYVEINHRLLLESEKKLYQAMGCQSWFEYERRIMRLVWTKNIRGKDILRDSTEVRDCVCIDLERYRKTNLWFTLFPNDIHRLMMMIHVLAYYRRSALRGSVLAVSNRLESEDFTAVIGA